MLGPQKYKSKVVNFDAPLLKLDNDNGLTTEIYS